MPIRRAKPSRTNPHQVSHRFLWRGTSPFEFPLVGDVWGNIATPEPTNQPPMNCKFPQGPPARCPFSTLFRGLGFPYRKQNKKRKTIIIKKSGTLFSTSLLEAPASFRIGSFAPRRLRRSWSPREKSRRGYPAARRRPREFRAQHSLPLAEMNMFFVFVFCPVGFEGNRFHYVIYCFFSRGLNQMEGRNGWSLKWPDGPPGPFFATQCFCIQPTKGEIVGPFARATVPTQ